MTHHAKLQGPLLYALAALSIFATGAALGEEPKASEAKYKFVRSLDPTTPPGLYYLLETIAVARPSATHVEVTGCSGGQFLLARDKMIDSQEQSCPNGRIPGLWWSYVVLGSVQSVQADLVTIHFETTGAGGEKKTLTIPKAALSKDSEIKVGTSVIFYHADLKSAMKQEKVVGDFKAFARATQDNPSKAWQDSNFKVQIQW